MTPEQAAQRAAYLELNRNESRIISERLRSMLTFHGLLFAAVGVSAGQRLFALALLLSIVGFVFCVPWFYSVELVPGPCGDWSWIRKAELDGSTATGCLSD